MTDKIVHAKVTSPTYINGVLHLPGEIAQVNLAELGVPKIGAKRTVKDDNGNEFDVELTPGLEAVSAKATDDLAQVEVAAVAPHAPDPDLPQGIPAGSVISGTGRILSPTTDEEDGLAAEMVPPATKPAAKAKG